MRRPLRILATVLLTCLPVPAAADPAGYVLFFQPFGDWATLCARDEATAITTCAANSPPPSLDGPPALVVHVTETDSNVYAVSVDVGANVAPGADVALRVDGGGDHVAPLDKDYAVHLGRDDSGRLVAEMLNGRTLTVRAAGFGSDPRPVYIGIPLGNFIDAFDRMRTNLRQYGIIRDPAGKNKAGKK